MAVGAESSRMEAELKNAANQIKVLLSLSNSAAVEPEK